MPANREPLQEASDRHSYYFRRSLTTRDYLVATGIAVGAALAAFYLTTRFSQRTPLLSDAEAIAPLRKRRGKGRAG